MKKQCSILAVLMLLSVLGGCGSLSKNDTPEALIQNYLTAVKDRDFEAIWDMIPEKIRDYAIEKEIIKDKKDGLDYIYYAVNDYYWLVKLDLPARKEFDLEILGTQEEDKQSVQKYLANKGIRLVVEEALGIGCLITVDGKVTQEASFFLIKSGDTWYLTSVVGDDEIFEY